MGPRRRYLLVAIWREDRGLAHPGRSPRRLLPIALARIPAPDNGAPEDRPRRPRAAFVVGDERTVADPESPRAIRLDRDADSRSDHDHLWFLGCRLKLDRFVAEQVAALVLCV